MLPESHACFRFTAASRAALEPPGFDPRIWAKGERRWVLRRVRASSRPASGDGAVLGQGDPGFDRFFSGRVGCLLLRNGPGRLTGGPFVRVRYPGESVPLQVLDHFPQPDGLNARPGLTELEGGSGSVTPPGAGSSRRRASALPRR